MADSMENLADEQIRAGVQAEQEVYEKGFEAGLKRASKLIAETWQSDDQVTAEQVCDLISTEFCQTHNSFPFVNTYIYHVACRAELPPGQVIYMDRLLELSGKIKSSDCLKTVRGLIAEALQNPSITDGKQMLITSLTYLGEK